MFGTYLELRKLRLEVELTTPYFCHYSHCNVSNRMSVQAKRTNPVATCTLFTKFNCACKVHQIVKIKDILKLSVLRAQAEFFRQFLRATDKLRRTPEARRLFVTAVDAARLWEMDRFRTTVRHAD